MKVLLISTSDRKGGAALACLRLFNALKKNGTDVKMLVRDKLTNTEGVYSVNTNIFKKIVNKAAYLAERIQVAIAVKLRRKNLFRADTGSFGVMGIADHPLVKEADVINIHWTSQGMLSISAIKKLMLQGKRIVFTMHDMHYFTGICHYANTCENYIKECGNCQYLGGGRNNDLSHKIFAAKNSLPGRNTLKFVACSNWLADVAKKSGMMHDCEILHAPNPIDTEVFRPMDKEDAKKRFGISSDKKVILCGADNYSDDRKGYKYLIKALHHIHSQNPQYNKKITLLIFGKGDIRPFKKLPYEIVQAGYIKTDADLAALYSAGDVYVSPSLEDNLPNTIMESLACSTPCAAFAIGGIPEMIENGVNGRLAKPKDHESLADAVIKILFAYDSIKLSQNARCKVETEFSEPIIAMRYNTIYREF